MKKVIKASSNRDEFVVRGNTWNETINKMKDLGFDVDSAYRRSPEDVVPFYYGKECWLCEVTKYFKGDYEIRSENMRRDTYFKDDNIEECDKITAAYADDDLIDDYDDEASFTEIACKQVQDSDGFMTEYTMYRDIESGEYVFVFGDRDIYHPEDGNFDWSCDTEEEAWEWFDSYGSEDSDDYDEDYYDEDDEM